MYHIHCESCHRNCIVPFKLWAFLFWFRHMWHFCEVYYCDGPDKEHYE
jgi:hypothetical protein